MKSTKLLSLILVVFMVLFFCSISLAATSTSSPVAEASLALDNKLVLSKQAAGPPYLHIYTTNTTGSVQQALTDHGISFDSFSGDDWSGIDLSGYNTVIIGMDGGNVLTASVQNVADFVSNGGTLIIIGGSSLSEWTTAVNTYLLENNTANSSWQISITPHLTVTDPSNPLAVGLPGTYNFTKASASVYQIKSTDTAADVAAVNGDGFAVLLFKPLGDGTLIWFMNSAAEGYWSNPTDYNIFSTIIANALDFGEVPPPSSIPTMNEWGMIVLMSFLGLGAFYYLRRDRKSEY
jgi:hypothetical protein